MSQPTLEPDLRYPIGKFDYANWTDRDENIRTIADLPSKLNAAVGGLTDEQLDTPYRPEGWTLRQTVHHIADSHINSLCRFKLALTEDNPTIRPYHENLWAELSDASLPIDASLKIVDGVHTRWAAMLSSMSSDDFGRTMQHPESGEWTLEKLLAMYAWHSRHHTAHITGTRERNDW